MIAPFVAYPGCSGLSEDIGRETGLVQPEAFVDEPSQARAIDQVVSQLFLRKHTQGRAPGIRSHFIGLFKGKPGILTDHRHDHAHHQLKAADSSGFVFVSGFSLITLMLSAGLGPLHFHTSPVAPQKAHFYWM